MGFYILTTTLVALTSNLVWVLLLAAVSIYIPKKRVITSISQSCWQELKECVGKSPGNQEVRQIRTC